MDLSNIFLKKIFLKIFNQNNILNLYSVDQTHPLLNRESIHHETFLLSMLIYHPNINYPQKSHDKFIQQNTRNKLFHVQTLASSSVVPKLAGPR